MGYEVYVKQFRKLENPQVRILPMGRLQFNMAAAKPMQKRGVEWVLLLWDAEMKRAALKPATRNDPGAYKVRYIDGGGAALSALTFLQYINYDYSKSRCFPICWNETENIYEIGIPVEHFRGSPLTILARGKKREKAPSHEEAEAACSCEK
jgi:hypothetical protein